MKSPLSAALAMPKSVTSTRPSAHSRMFAGLMSRWTSPAGGRRRARRRPGRRSPRTSADVERAVLVEAGPQGGAADQLHDDGLDALVPERVVDGHDRRVGEAGRGDGLGSEPAHERAVGGEVGVEDLDRDPSGQDLVGGLPHLGHAAGRDAAGEPIPTGEEATREVASRWLGRGQGRFGHDAPTVAPDLVGPRAAHGGFTASVDDSCRRPRLFGALGVSESTKRTNPPDPSSPAKVARGGVRTPARARRCRPPGAAVGADDRADVAERELVAGRSAAR